jgi:hypothetical protein
MKNRIKSMMPNGIMGLERVNVTKMIVVTMWIVTVLVMMTVMITGDLKQIMPGDNKNLTHIKQPQRLHCYHPQGIDNCKNERITSSISLPTTCYQVTDLSTLTLMIPGRSTSTMRCRPGPFTDIEITSVLTVWPPRILFFIRIST